LIFFSPGNKTDLRNNASKSRKYYEAKAKKLKVDGYFECAATNPGTVKEVLLLLLNWPTEFPRVIRLVEQAAIHMSLEEVIVYASYRVLIVIDLYFTDCW
jgi:hypothetical protein